MVTVLHLKGMQEFEKYVATLDSNTKVFFCFTGQKLPSGESWCTDCNQANPVISAWLEDLKNAVTFVYVDVGDRDTWKDKKCVFRTNKKTRLMVIPTILKWNGVQRLEGEQCARRDLLDLLLDDDDF